MVPIFPTQAFPVPLQDCSMPGKQRVKGLQGQAAPTLLQPLALLDRVFNILMSSLWLPLCNLSPVVLLAPYRGGGPPSLSISPFPVARRLTGEPTPLVAGHCPHQLQFTGATPSPPGFVHSLVPCQESRTMPALGMDPPRLPGRRSSFHLLLRAQHPLWGIRSSVQLH